MLAPCPVGSLNHNPRFMGIPDSVFSQSALRSAGELPQRGAVWERSPTRSHPRILYRSGKPAARSCKASNGVVQKESLSSQPPLLAIMRVVGLFDRPASDSCLRVLRESPPIQGLGSLSISRTKNGIAPSVVFVMCACWPRLIHRFRPHSMRIHYYVSGLASASSKVTIGVGGALPMDGFMNTYVIRLRKGEARHSEILDLFIKR